MNTRVAGAVWGAALTIGLGLVVMTAHPVGLVVLAAAGAIPPPIDPRDVRKWWSIVAAIWAVLILMPSLLSDDIYRYLLDGTMTRAGFNPFAWAPAAPTVADIAPQWRAMTNHPQLRTIYPAAAQVLFATLAWTPLTWKLATAGTWLAFCRWLDSAHTADEGCSGRSVRVGSPPGLVLALHPLALLAVGLDGHVDAWGAVLLGVGLVLHGRHSKSGDSAVWGALVGLAAAIKYFPLIALGVRGHRARATVAAAVIFGLTSLPFVVGAGNKATGSLGEYQQHWTYNGAIFGATATALQPRDPPESVQCPRQTRPSVWQGETLSACHASPAATARARARLVWLLLVLAVTLGAAALWSDHPQAAARTVFVGFSVFLVSSPTAHGWYFLWLLVPAVLQRERGALLICASGVLAFWSPVLTLAGDAWQDVWWPTPVGLTAAAGLWGARAMSRWSGTRRGEHRLTL